MECTGGDCEGEIVDKLTMLCAKHNRKIGRFLRERGMYHRDPLAPFWG